MKQTKFQLEHSLAFSEVIYLLCFPLLFYLLRTNLQIHLNLISKLLISDHSDQSHHLSGQFKAFNLPWKLPPVHSVHGRPITFSEI